MTGVRDFVAANRLGESGNEPEEVSSGIGGVEPLEILRGMDPFSGDLEIAGRRDGDYFLGLRDGGEHYGLLLGAEGFRGNIDGRGTDGPVGRRR